MNREELIKEIEIEYRKLKDNEIFLLIIGVLKKHFSNMSLKELQFCSADLVNKLKAEEVIQYIPLTGEDLKNKEE